MANTLYDLLEVNQSASAEAIAAGYKRLHARHAESAANGDEDANNRLIALREAFTTLSEPGRRQRYDNSLASRDREGEAAPAGFPFVKLIVIACIVGFFAITYQKYQAAQEAARLEAERVVAAAKTAEAEARKATEERLAAEGAERQRQRDEAIERASRQRDIAYGNQVSRNLDRAEADARWAAQREEQARASAERQKEYEAERALAREKAYLRQVEAEKSRYRY